jgi:hypothetical protein
VGREQVARQREDRIRTFVEGHRFDPATHRLFVTAIGETWSEQSPQREAISIVPRADHDEIEAGLPAEQIRARYPTFILPREIDTFALNREN